MRLIFFGTSDFAVPALTALVKEGYAVVVVTSPDAPAGRDKVLTPSPVKLAAKKLGLKVFQPSSLEIGNWKLEIKNAPLGIVAAYGKIIAAEIINLFPRGILNIHPSLLPKYRGPSPIQSALLNGDTETGVTIIRIDAEIDHGPIISSQGIVVSSKDLYKDLEGKSAKLGAELLVKTLPDYLTEKIELKEQNHNQATFTKMIKKEDGKIDWHKSAAEIYNQFRAFHYWPGIWTRWNGKILKLLEIDIFTRSYKTIYIGKVILEDGRLIIPCSKQAVEILFLQLPGGKPLSAREFTNGYGRFLTRV